MAKAVVFLAEGFEEIEAITPIDYLRRAGVQVETVAIPVGGKADALVTGSHKIPVKADLTFDELAMRSGDELPDAVVVPGGMPGAKNLAEFEPLMKVLAEHYSAGGGVAAICASPAVVLAAQGELFAGCEMTCYDGFEASLAAAGIAHKAAGSVSSGRVVTGRGPGYAVEFALAVLTAIKDADLGLYPALNDESPFAANAPECRPRSGGRTVAFFQDRKGAVRRRRQVSRHKGAGDALGCEKAARADRFRPSGAVHPL